MRKTTAIFLLLIHAYNLIGYKAVFLFLERQANISLASKLDEGQFSDAGLIEMKIPFKLLYNADWPDYVRYDGQIDIKGLTYNYVKRKFARDTLYLLCIPNEADARLASSKNNYLDNLSNSANPLSRKAKSSVNGLLKAYSTDFHQPSGFNELVCITDLRQCDYTSSARALLTNFIPVSDKPPKV